MNGLTIVSVYVCVCMCVLRICAHVCVPRICAHGCVYVCVCSSEILIFWHTIIVKQAYHDYEFLYLY